MSQCQHGIDVRASCPQCDHARLQGEPVTLEERVARLEKQVKSLADTLINIQRYETERIGRLSGHAAKFLVKMKYAYAWYQHMSGDRAGVPSTHRIWSDGGDTARVLGEGGNEDEAWIAAQEAIR